MHVAPFDVGKQASAVAPSDAGIPVSAAASSGAGIPASVAAPTDAGIPVSVAAPTDAGIPVSVAASTDAVHWAVVFAQPVCCSADFAVGQGTDILFYPEQLLQRKESRSEKLLK